ncbi:MAG: hypothetical protein HYR96_15835 [Deltaproteobacteria bacterium]|nr:hypothetical protein [Deltaproteobacteria bacterium]MBI3294465.1 hypothetical protein [Deltaproteobacteria bacterium]
MTLTLYRLLWPLAFLLTLLLAPFSQKLRRGLWGRIGLTARIRKLKLSQPLWFHFSSAGEFEQSLSVIDTVHARSPEIPIFLSYFSPSARGAIEREAKRRNHPPPWRAADYAPFDFAPLASRYYDALNPRALVVINRELWPELTHQAKSRRIPLSLIASFFAKHTGGQGPALFDFDWIGTVDEGSKAYLERLGAHSVTVMGDPRIERILARKQTLKPWADFFTGQNLVLGSIWPDDFLALRDTFPVLAKKGWRLIFVPHEPTPRFVSAIMTIGKNWGGVRRWSHFLRSPDDQSHLIVDSVGVLADLYSIATAAFVGGSFKSRVHNIAEPAAYGIPILTGPKIQNSAEARELKDLGSLFVIDSGQNTVSILEKAVLDKDTISTIQTHFFDRNHGVATRYAEKILT